MLKSGLVSISFRKLTTDEIIKMVSNAGLDAIEWGGDLHVPHGNLFKASQVKMSCDLVGIKCPSYGSYYRVGEYSDPKEEFKKVLGCAAELDSEQIRIWAGVRPTVKADDDYWKIITEELRMICQMASSDGRDVSLEYHANTLTDNSTDTMRLLARTNEENLFTYWQPPAGLEHAINKKDIEMLKSHISNIHVFSWDGRDRLILSEKYEQWQEYFKLINTWKLRYCMLEFFKDDSVENFYKDSATLKELLKDYE